jgi:hypothetical protein
VPHDGGAKNPGSAGQFFREDRFDCRRRSDAGTLHDSCSRQTRCALSAFQCGGEDPRKEGQPHMSSNAHSPRWSQQKQPKKDAIIRAPCLFAWEGGRFDTLAKLDRASPSVTNIVACVGLRGVDHESAMDLRSSVDIYAVHESPYVALFGPDVCVR